MKNDETRKRFSRFRQRRDAKRAQWLAHQEEFYRKSLDHPSDLNSKKFRQAPRKWIIMGMSIFSGAMCICFILSFAIIQFIFEHWFPDGGNLFLRQLLTVILMMMIFALMITLVRFIFDPGRYQFNTFLMLMSAMRRMANGDFDAKLDVQPHQAGQFGILVKSFNDMATQLSHMETMRQEFISNVSHEFQSPLTSIGGFARALQSDNLPEETRRHYLAIIVMEIARLSKLSDNLLKLTSLESNQHPFEPKAYRLDRQLRRVILACEPQWREKKLAMDVDLPEMTITADEELLDQVWINLIHNAVKFTPENGTIRITLERREGRIRAEVCDSGIGVSPEDLPYLFERFYKADKARSRTGGGSGLGLSIVRKIVEMHGGEVTADSRPGEGTTFLVTLPTAVQPHSSKLPPL